MKTIKSALTGLLMAAALPVFASPAVVDFEDLATKIENTANKQLAASAQTYANGAVTIGSSDAWLLTSKGVYADAVGNFYGTVGTDETAFGANSAALFLIDTSGNSQIGFHVGITNGFKGAFSVAFAGSGSVSFIAYGADGKQIAGAGDSGITPSNADCEASLSCIWDTMDFDFGSTAVYALDIIGTNGKVFFDNLSFGDLLAAPTNPGNVPEPGGVALSLAALGALGWTRKRVARR